MDLTIIYVETSGLYQDGKGMSGEAHRVWQDYWMNYAKVFWKQRVTADAIYIASTFGGGMIHPERFYIPILGTGPHVRMEVDELNEAMRELAERLHFAYSIHTRTHDDVDLGKPVLVASVNCTEGRHVGK